MYSGNSPKKLAYLGESIFEIQQSWKGPDHLKQANYVFHSQPKGLRFLRAVSTKESPKEMGLKGIQDLEALLAFRWIHILPVVWKIQTERGDHRKSPKNGALQVRSHMQLVLWLSYNYGRHSPLTWPHHLHRLGHYLQGGFSACLLIGVHLGNFIATDPPFPRKVTILDG